MQAKWTPGPWEISKPPRFVTNSNGEVVADIAANHPMRLAANARLIAAAPELAEAVALLLAHHVRLAPYESDSERDAERIARAALKAAGWEG